MRVIRLLTISHCSFIEVCSQGALMSGLFGLLHTQEGQVWHLGLRRMCEKQVSGWRSMGKILPASAIAPSSPSLTGPNLWLVLGLLQWLCYHHLWASSFHTPKADFQKIVVKYTLHKLYHLNPFKCIVQWLSTCL